MLALARTEYRVLQNDPLHLTAKEMQSGGGPFCNTNSLTRDDISITMDYLNQCHGYKKCETVDVIVNGIYSGGTKEGNSTMYYRLNPVT